MPMPSCCLPTHPARLQLQAAAPSPKQHRSSNTAADMRTRPPVSRRKFPGPGTAQPLLCLVRPSVTTQKFTVPILKSLHAEGKNGSTAERAVTSTSTCRPQGCSSSINMGCSPPQLIPPSPAPPIAWDDGGAIAPLAQPKQASKIIHRLD